MQDWRDAVNQYQQGSISVAQGNLQEGESLMRSKAQMVGANVSEKIAQAGTDLGNQLSATQNQVMDSLGIDLSANALKTPVMNALKYGANWRGSVLRKRQVAAENAPKPEQEPTQYEPTEGVTGPEQTLQDARFPAPSGRATSGTLDDEPVGSGASTGDRFLTDSGQRADPIDPNATASGTVDDPLEMQSFEMADPAGTGFLDSLPASARGIGSTGAAVRDYTGYGGSATSRNMGDAINESRSAVNPNVDTQPRFQSSKTAEDEEFGDEDLEQQSGLGRSVNMVRPTVRGEGAAPGAEPDLQGGDTLVTPKITVQDVDQDVDTATTRAQNLEQNVEPDIADVGEGLASDLGKAASSWESVASGLGEAIPYVGAGLAIWGLVSGAEGLAKEAKDAASDPYAKLRGAINTADGQINTLQANISSDQFESKIGAGAPRFGSIAASGDMGAKQQSSGPAIHV